MAKASFSAYVLGKILLKTGGKVHFFDQKKHDQFWSSFCFFPFPFFASKWLKYAVFAFQKAQKVGMSASKMEGFPRNSREIAQIVGGQDRPRSAQGLPTPSGPEPRKSPKRVLSGFGLCSDSFETPGRTLSGLWGSRARGLFRDSFRTLSGFRARRGRETLCRAGPILTKCREHAR